MSRRVYAIALAVVADALRRKIIYIVLLFAAVMSAAIPLLPSYGVGVVEAVYREVALALMFAAALIVTLALAVTRVPSEIERRTIYNVLSRSTRRWEYLFGTWLGIVLTMAGVITAFGCVAFLIGWVVYGVPMWQLWQGIFSIWLESGVIAAFCIAVSAVAGPVVVATAAVSFVFVAHARAGLLSPDQALYRVYPSLDAFNIINPVAHGSGVTAGYLLTMTLVFFAWIGVLLLLASAVFERRDL